MSVEEIETFNPEDLESLANRPRTTDRAIETRQLVEARQHMRPKNGNLDAGQANVQTNIKTTKKRRASLDAAVKMRCVERGLRPHEYTISKYLLECVDKAEGRIPS